MSTPHRMLRALALLGLALSTAAQAQTATGCPAALPAAARCYTGADQNGATYWIAIPEKWNRVLVMHAHGGPRLSRISRDSSLEDLERFSVTVRQGYAWAGSSYRRPGYGVKMAAEDTENLRRIFIDKFGQPGHTLLHGQSWGGNVAAKGIEVHGGGSEGRRPYDGVILTNGMLAGGTRNYPHRADLRAVYQYYCNNHPRADEPQYPLWMGLPADSAMTPRDLEQRVDECTGVKLPAGQRSAQQQARLQDILAVVPVPERTLVSHLNWATFMFRDLNQRFLGGRNPFSNRDIVYRGSADDEALNREVQRFDADPEAVKQLADDSDMQGLLPVPVLSMHAIDDPTAMVEYESHYRDVVAAAGRQAMLVQTFTDEREHSKLADPEYAALFDGMMQWIRDGERPTPHKIAAACERHAQQFQGGCHFRADYTPGPLLRQRPAK